MEYNDKLYGTINIPNDIWNIINTELFQRLKKIKQLGLLSYVFPEAVGTRFEHCIGTYYRAKQMLDTLIENKKRDDAKFDLPRVYYQAVVIGALLHDIGHGPFSHTWENVNSEYNHEENSAFCVDHIFHDLPHNYFLELRDNNSHGIEVIKAIIMGDSKLASLPVPMCYMFIFEIVNNNKNVDVDKWDYLKRDNFYLETKCPNLDLDFDDIFINARITADGAHIEYNYADYGKIYKLFEARQKMHLNCYRVLKCMACDHLLKEHVHKELDNSIPKDILKINAKDKKAFIEFHDAYIVDLIQGTTLSEILHDVSKIQIINDVGKEHFKVDKDVPGPGSVMPHDDKFMFYGDASKKPTIVRDVTSFHCVGLFVIQK